MAKVSIVQYEKLRASSLGQMRRAKKRKKKKKKNEELEK